ncbi:MAG TPA: LamG domain-containing protein [Clostridia bacterium]|nr:LamG domain-containing protein [Clostridia bacterium]
MKSRPSMFSKTCFAALAGTLLASSASAADYQSIVLSDSPLAYYRLGESSSTADVARNSGSLGTPGNGIYQKTRHRVIGALAGNGNAAAALESSDGSPVIVPYNAALNPSGAFTVEAWFKPAVATDDGAGPCPLFNRKTAGARQGWVFFQRSPGTGWNFRTYGNGVDSGTTVNITGGSYTVGQWVHLAATYDGTTVRLYVDGAEVASGNPTAYQGNSTAALAVGSYSDLVGSGPAYQNPFIGHVDEVALYSTALSGSQILSHYNNGIDPARTTPYESLIAAHNPVAYLRLDEADPAIDVALSYGTLGPVADAIHTPGVRHPVPGPLVGNPAETAASYTGILNADGGSPTYLPATQTLRICELWDDVGVGLIQNQGDGSTSFGFDSAAKWDGNAEGLIRVAQDFDIEGPPGPPYAQGHRGGLWNDAGGGNWNTTSWATRQLTPSAQINFLVDAEYWITVRVDNTGDTAMGVGFASAGDGAAEFVGVGAMWDNYSPDNSANSSLYISQGTISGADGPYAVRAHGPTGVLAGPGTIVARLTTTAGGSHTLEAAVFAQGTQIPSDPVSITWETTHTFSSTMTATHLLVWLNGAGQGNLDAIRVANSFTGMFTDSASPLNLAGSFTIEAWVKPTVNGFGNAQCPLHNRAATRGDGGGDRSGWDFFQRDASEGWNFRMFNGVGSTRVFNITGGPYTVDQWQHLVAVYNASVPSATLYLDGVEVATSSSPDGTYAPRTFGGLAIGSYSSPWMNPSGYENSFAGSIGQVAIYTNALSVARIQAHYNNAKSASPSTPYKSVVLSDNPVAYWPLNEGSHHVATNLGSLATVADGVYVNTTDGVAGPQSPAFVGFETANKAKSFNGSSSYVELLNPSGLNLSGQITLEAWVQPAAAQNYFAHILSHGVNGAGDAEDVLRLSGGNSYLVASWDGTASYGISSPAPSTDVGSGNWVYLAGTYDGVNWNLYRNGVLEATVAGSSGAVPVYNAGWAIGGRGRWHQAFGYEAATRFPDRLFTGAIDEAAIYDIALSPERIQAHWYMGKYGTLTPPQPSVKIQGSGADVILTWVGVLVEADSAAGPYTEVPGAVSPYTVPANNAGKFYRAKL